MARTASPDASYDPYLSPYHTASLAHDYKNVVVMSYAAATLTNSRGCMDTAVPSVLDDASVLLVIAAAFLLVVGVLTWVVIGYSNSVDAGQSHDVPPTISTFGGVGGPIAHLRGVSIKVLLILCADFW